MTAFNPTAEEMQTVLVKLYFERNGDPEHDLPNDIESCEIYYAVTCKQDYINALGTYKLLNQDFSYSEDSYQKICDYEQKLNLKRQDSLSPERVIIPAFQLQTYDAGKTCKHYNNGQPFHLYNLAHSYHINYSGELIDMMRLENGVEVELEQTQQCEFKIRYAHQDNVEAMLARHPISYVLTAELKAAQNKGQYTL